MTEFKIGERVRFVPVAAVSENVIGLTAVVQGYDAVGDEDFVIVTVNLRGQPTEQWVLPRELTPAGAGTGKGN